MEAIWYSILSQRATVYMLQKGWIVVYCIGCVRAMQSGGKIPHYLPDLLIGRQTESMPDNLNEYHTKLEDYIEKR